MERRRFIQLAGGTAVLLTAAPDFTTLFASQAPFSGVDDALFAHPPRTAGPWVVWHWTNANQTREGVTADLEGMATMGIAGASLFSFPPGAASFRGPGTVVDQAPAPLTPAWFDLIHHAVSEAGRLGITLALQISAGWATAGGDWIQPEDSQQQLVWSERIVEGGQGVDGALARPRRAGERDTEPQAWRDYYRDLAVLAFPIPAGWGETNRTRGAVVTATLPVGDIGKLTDISNQELTIDTETGGHLQFSFDAPFTLRSIRMNPGSRSSNSRFGVYNRPAHSMEVQASDDGVTFRRIGALEPMAHSWQTRLTSLTHTIPETTARHFRLVYNPAPPIGYDEHMQSGSYRGSGGFGFEPGEVSAIPMLDMIDPLLISSLELSSTPVVHHWEGKSGLVWGMSRRVTDAETPSSACVPMDALVDLTDRMRADGTLNWQAPAGSTWKVLRFGYTTMGRTNGEGIGQGLESDKFSEAGARAAFNGWYARVIDDIGAELASRVLTMLNVDSWECGSQNWSPVMREAFRARRGYDAIPYLPAMAGIPVESADISESFLFDLRHTIADLISDNYVATLNDLARSRGSQMQMEAVPPGMICDGLSVHKHVDVTAGEFWVTAWQNWKPCDIAEAAHAAHIYGKAIVMAEAFTGGGDWKEHPYDLKAMGDLHFADGINRFMLHLWAAQPYPGRVPGQTGAAGTYINQHTTWFEPGKAWIDYLRRCQMLLQSGYAVRDVAYFIGESVPCRALIPPRYGSYFVTDPPLPQGYAYDSINRDVLLNHARAENGMLVLDRGARYHVLVLRPDRLLTPQMLHKVRELALAGVSIVGPMPTGSPSLEMASFAAHEVPTVAGELWGDPSDESPAYRRIGNGRIFRHARMDEVLTTIGVAPDLLFHRVTHTERGTPYEATAYEPHGIDPTLYGAARQGWGLVWNHKRDGDSDVYFLSNQEQFPLSCEASFRIEGRVPELWHPDTGVIEDAAVWRVENGRTVVPMDFDPAGSVFVVFRRVSRGLDPVSAVDGTSDRRALRLRSTPAGLERWASASGSWGLKTMAGFSAVVTATDVPAPRPIEGPWQVTFPLLTLTNKRINLELGSWTAQRDAEIKHFSGTATYRKQIELPVGSDGVRLFLDLGDVKNLARVRLNGQDLGVLWKPPYRVDLTPAAKTGPNALEIEVTNTWHNRLVRDAGLPEAQRQTWLLGSGPSADAALEPAGLLGPVRILTEVRV
ncbi:MAG: glycosyl hydrolase [Rhodothermales bacterium]